MVSDVPNGLIFPADSVTQSSGAIPCSLSVPKVVTNHVKCIQLDKDNYFSCKAKFSAMLKGFELMDYFDGGVDLSTLSTCQQTKLYLC